MLRCGQMLLAEAGVRRHLGRAWRWSSDCRDEAYLKLVSMFEDQNLAPFSLHVMTSLGQLIGKSIGEWYGPNMVAHLIRRLPEFDMWNNYAVSVVTDIIIFADETRALSKQSHPNGWDPLLVLIPLRLGMDHFNPDFIYQLKKFFRIPQALGILGGTPSHALYLIGYVGDDVIFLDPHTTQDSVTVGNKDTEEQAEADATYHCRTTPHMPFTRLDPSMAMCFLCNSEAEYTDLIERLRSNFTKEFSTSNQTALLEVMDTRPDHVKDFELDDECKDSFTGLSGRSEDNLESSKLSATSDGDGAGGSGGGCDLVASPDTTVDDVRQGCKNLVLSHSSKLECDSEALTDQNECLPQNSEVCDIPRTSVTESQKNHTGDDSGPNFDIYMGMPAQDSDSGEEEADAQLSRDDQNSRDSSRSNTPEPFEFL